MKNYLPLMLIKSFIILPFETVKVEINNIISREIVKIVMKHHDGYLIFTSPLNDLEEDPDISDLPNVGVLAHIKSKINLPNGNIRLEVEGITRVNILKYTPFDDNKDIIMCSTKETKHIKEDPIEATAYRRKITTLLKEYISRNPLLTNSILEDIKNVDDLDTFTDLVVSFIPLPNNKKVIYCKELSPIERADSLIDDLAIEMTVLKLDAKIDAKINKSLENKEKEYVLKSKLEEIKKELGIDQEQTRIITTYEKMIENSKAPLEVKVKLQSELKKYSYMEANPEMSIVRNYLDTVLSLPYGEYQKETSSLEEVKEALNKSHYGLDKIKDRIVEYLAVKKRNNNIKSLIICLVGPPGVGKTTLGMAIAKALNKPFYKISVGGLNDPAELVGHRRTYLGSAPGKIIQALAKTEVANPLILIDEVDKMQADYKGDPAAALLDILDQEQNKMFIDNYIEEPFDLSQVMFILTANDLQNVPTALKDRLEIITLSTYTEVEKISIAKKYLLPRMYDEYLLNAKDLKISDSNLNYIITSYTKEAGVRELSRVLETITRKIIRDINEKNIKLPFELKKDDINKYLGKEKYQYLSNKKSKDAGLVNALAYTPLGGLVTPIEACLYEGKGDILATGMLGKSMDESIKVALSYLRSNEQIFKLNSYYFSNKNIHLHAIDGATPKDGPSAGLAITTTILSLLLNKPIDSDIAMTGEISLKGDILPVGGLKEKILGAYNNGIHKIFIPLENEKDLEEIPFKVLSKIKIIKVSNYLEVYKELFK